MARRGGSTPAARRLSLRALVLAPAAVLVLAAGVLTWWLLTRVDTPDSVAQPDTPLTAARAQQLAELMTSGDEGLLRRALVLPPEQPLEPSLARGLAGMQLDIDSETYEPTSEETATVEATTTDPAGSRTDWTLGLLLTDAGWQVVHTVPREDS